MAEPRFEVRVEGEVPDTDLDDLGAVTLGHDQVSTVLYGIADEAALFGLLERLRSLGIGVVELRRVPQVADPEANPEPVDGGVAR